MKQHTLKNVNNCLNTNIYPYLETSGGQISNLYLNIVHFFNTSGLYYKHVTIVIDAPSVVKVMLQIVASLTIVIDDAS